MRGSFSLQMVIDLLRYNHRSSGIRDLREPNSRTTLIDEQSNPSQLVHQEDVMSRHREELHTIIIVNISAIIL